MTKKNDNYEDIISLLHHQSARHPHMKNADRAAQFSAFAALTGLDDEMDEAERQYIEGAQ